MSIPRILGYTGWLLISLFTYIGVEWAVGIYPYFAWFISLFMFVVGITGVFAVSISKDTEVLKEFIDNQTILIWGITFTQWVVTIYLLNLTECFTQLHLYVLGAIFILCSVAIAYIKQRYQGE